MYAWFADANGILRRARWVTGAADVRRVLVRLALQLILFGLLYGVAMGSFRLVAAQSQWFLQIVYSATKVPLLLSTTFFISLPSFYVVNTLLGLRRDFTSALRALVAAQAGLAIVLSSLAPMTLFWYATSVTYDLALLFNGVMFATASFAAQRLLRSYYRPLIARNHRHRWVLWGWLVAYTFVGIQMAWLLRPFIGAPGKSVHFLRPDPWDNAYEVVARLVWRTFFP